MTGTRSYTFTGYDPDDALEGGRWVLGAGRVQVWVPDPVVLHIVPDPEPIACWCGATVTQTCVTRNGYRTKDHPARKLPRVCPCGAALGWKKRLCDPCWTERARQQKRDYRARLALEAS
jgi:hypothetical protein